MEQVIEDRSVLRLVTQKRGKVRRSPDEDGDVHIHFECQELVSVSLRIVILEHMHVSPFLLA